MTKNPTEVSAVQAAVILIVTVPEPGTAFLTTHVESFVRAMARTMEFAVTTELVTVTLVPAAAMFTVPLGLLIV